jgi:plasmid maintenance system killer protein
VELLFDDPEFATVCNDERLLRRRHNVQRAKLLRRRLDDVRAAPTLETMRNLPGRCHELKGDRAGQLSLDLDGPNRLILRPAASPPPTKSGGGLDWSKVTAVVVVEVIDTHE